MHAAPFAVDEAIPPGYRLTDEARSRLFSIAQAVNRHERRGLLAFFRKHPVETFERDVDYDELALALDERRVDVSLPES